MGKHKIKEILIFKRPNNPSYCPVVFVFDDGETEIVYTHIDVVVQRVEKIQKRLVITQGNPVRECIWM